jgi:two-component system, chemotaxis family, chemotaxis protein CheY
VGKTKIDGVGPRILVVDDDPDWREYLRVSLAELGYQTLEAKDGKQALELLAREHVSIVLLDLNMPGMSGEEVLAHLPSPGPRIVFVTSATAQDASGALSRGAHYYLPKGARPHELSLLLTSLAA